MMSGTAETPGCNGEASVVGSVLGSVAMPVHDVTMNLSHSPCPDEACVLRVGEQRR